MIHFDHFDIILHIPLSQHMFMTCLCFSHFVSLGKVDLDLEFALFLQRSKHPVDTPQFTQHCSCGDTFRFMQIKYVSLFICKMLFFKNVIYIDHLDNSLHVPSFQHMFIAGLYFSHRVLLGKFDPARALVLFLQRSIHPVDTPRFMQHCSSGDASK